MSLWQRKLGSVRRRNAGGFLAAVLQRVEPQVGEFRGFGMAKNTENAALVVEAIVGNLDGAVHSGRNAC